MAKLLQITPDDFEFVYPLLLDFRNPDHTREDWHRLFSEHPDQGPGYCGYALVEDRRAVGFLGYKFSKRTIRGEIHALCNIHNWIVKPSHRHASLSLLLPAMRLEDVTLTNHTPTPEVRTICKRLGFSVMDATQRIIVPGGGFGSLLQNVRLCVGAQEVLRHVDPQSAKLITDHRLPHHCHALIQSQRGNCLVIMNRTHKRIHDRLRVPMLHCHHVDNREVFQRYARRAASQLCVHFGAVGLILMERYLRDPYPRMSLRRPGGPFEAMYKSDRLGPEDIDGLYSEMSLLNY